MSDKYEGNKKSYDKLNDAKASSVGYVADLEKFMIEVSVKLKCLPDFTSPHPEKGNKHIIEKLNELLSK